MAKIEEIAELSGIERWKAQRLARKLDGDIQQLKVALSELDTVKPKKTTYTKKANVFFFKNAMSSSRTRRVSCCWSELFTAQVLTVFVIPQAS
ncbi:hypothetical protein L914_15761 [Phytophthora nicotianae]|uniref:Uncharacterized protein n=2 Tax=Phytophthora nicotianae TaxID=4792 RepID=W2MN74_PHYNI|nr:hypothetical protein L914_15761 [Phytophthora nicotianae]ETO66544.1 hypothetical protein F444_16347 [Phytophthora nicotianae P1976]